ncbi:hypothetical protein HUU62_17905 [Rhodoferax sp. 4810]|uniref:Uncharacterized protein n=1 Tax=Thiospirillum jenense TaxID=1653858 RepID=A0A839HBR7_9GAMM|nr:hypothetical protein [Thiospirillum jenense]MBB1076283.1 hypothetical protein [Rhodoferax jenense]MBB1124876.1 hypothetical protein [Thiospirillum jenense]
MKSHWADTLDLDAHIAIGQVATEAESAEMLSWLLKLEPEQRWCLLLSRDPRLLHLVAGDYRRLLTLMVELESAALHTAAAPPCASAESSPPLLALPNPFTPPPSHWHWRSIAVSTVVLVSATGFWLTTPGGQDHWQQWRSAISHIWNAPVNQSTPAPAVTVAERQRQALVAFVLVETIAKKLAEGQAFAPELAALRTIWPGAAQLEPLLPFAAPVVPTPAALRDELARLNAKLTQQHSDLITAAQTGRLNWADFYAQLPLLEQRRTPAEAALSQVRDGNWSAATATLAAHPDAGYQAWRAQVTRWLDAQQVVTQLVTVAWSQHDWSAPAAAPTGE